MTLDDLRALADKFFEWPEGSGRQTVTTFSALLFAQHVLQLREKSLGTENSAGMDALRNAAQRQLDALGGYRREIGLLTGVPDEQPCDAEVALRAALEQDEKPVAKIRTWHKGGEQNAELWDWDDGIETLPDGEHLLYASAPLRAALEQEQAEPAWVCPESPEHRYAKPGHCEDCGKTLVLEQKAEPVAEDAKQQALDALNRMQSILMMSGGRHPRDVLRTYIQLTAAQPQRKPLTDDRLWELWNIDSDEAYKNCPTYFQEFRYTARLVERAHGIGEEK